MSHVQCIYCDARSDVPLCEECSAILDRYRHHVVEKRTLPAPFGVNEFVALLQTVCAEYNVQPTAVLTHARGRNGPRDVVAARHTLYRRMRDHELTLQTMGAWVMRERSTLWHALHARKARV
jgi:hypothetical protein